MNELVKVDPKEFGLEESKAKELTKGLTVILEEREVLKKSYIETIELEITEENIPVFKELRLKIRDNRTKGIEPWHKVNKQFFLTGGRFVDAIKNKEVLENEQMESKLMEAEKHFENLEKERIEKLTIERVKECLPYVEDESLIVPDLGAMPKSLWNNYIIGLKTSYEARIAAEKKAEAEKLAAEKAEIERQKAIEKENVRLKAEAEAAAKKQEAERLERERLAKIEAKKKAKEEKKQIALHKAGEERRELLFNIGVSLDFQTCRDMDGQTWNDFYREKMDFYQAEQNRLHLEKLKEERKLLEERKKAEEKTRIEAEKARKLASKLKAREDADRRAKEEDAARLQAELNKGDKAKVQDLINDLNSLKEKYSFKSEKNKIMYNQVGQLIDKVVNHINK